MKTRIIDSEKRKAFEQSWKRDQYRHPQGDIAKFNACFFANAFVSELEGENGASLNVDRCFLGFDQCSGCGHHQDCALRRLRISIINAIDFSAKHYRKQFKKGGAQ